jgi:probable HAF family extracellular repeat protein
LNTVDGDACSVALDMNSQGQVVGSSGDCDLATNQHAFLWEDGAIVDLNALVPPGSGLQLQFAFQTNERGEIGGFGALENGDPRAFVLIPRDSDGESGATPSVTGRENPVSARPGPSVSARSGKNGAATDAAAARRHSRRALRFGQMGTLVRD